jgi:hypothetical protein
MHEYKTFLDGEVQVFGGDVSYNPENIRVNLKRHIQRLKREIESLALNGYVFEFDNNDHYLPKYVGFEVRLIGIKIKRDNDGKPIKKQIKERNK